MSKRMQLIQKGDSNSKHFSFFVFFFNVSNNISSTPPWLLNFCKNFPNRSPPRPPRLLSFEKFSNTPLLNRPSIRHSRVLYVKVSKSSQLSCWLILHCFLVWKNFKMSVLETFTYARQRLLLHFSEPIYDINGDLRTYITGLSKCLFISVR